jgi:hypothetical protein
MTSELHQTEISARDHRLMLWEKKKREVCFCLTHMTKLFDVVVTSCLENPLETVRGIIANARTGFTPSIRERMEEMRVGQTSRLDLAGLMYKEFVNLRALCPRTRYLEEFNTEGTTLKVCISFFIDISSLPLVFCSPTSSLLNSLAVNLSIASSKKSCKLPHQWPTPCL